MQPVDRRKEIVFLHFNDAYDINRNKNDQLGFVNFYESVQKMRKIYPKSLLIFSGDAFAPSSLSRIYKGQQMVHCLKLLNIDIACYGNHDFDFPPAHALRLAEQCKFPWLLGNVKYKDTQKNIGNALDHLILDYEGVKIGFIGLAGPDFVGRLISDYKDKVVYTNLSEYAAKMCKILRSQGCELIVAVTHCRRPADEALAKEVPEIDLILGGHDHHRMVLHTNKTPLIKSGSDFEFLSVVKVQEIENQKAGNEAFFGRRWFTEVEVKKVGRAVNKYPQLQEYIEKAIQGKLEFDQKKSLLNNKLKEKAKQLSIKLPEDVWQLSFGIMNNRQTISLKAGLSAQVCFAKYVAFKRKMFYAGHKRGAPELTPNFIHESVQFVCQEILSHKNNGNTVLFSPGLCNVPYLFQTCNFVYLPSQFLIGVNSITQLQRALKTANEKEIKCYAVVGYDPFIKDQLCAWIKFIEMPQRYKKVIKQLKIQNVVLMSVHDQKGNNHGSENTARLLRRTANQKAKIPCEEDIYMIFVNEGYLKKPQKDIEIFKKIINDVNIQQWTVLASSPITSYIHDWQGGIDCLDSLQNSVRSIDKNISLYRLVDSDSWNLYLTAYHIGKQFIQFNYDAETHDIKAKGIVFNQYIMSNPLYQLNYGYIPILYWQFYNHNEARIMGVLNQQEKKLKRWFNVHKGTHLNLVEKDSKVIQTTHEGYQLSAWVTKHAPKEYCLRFLPFQIFRRVLQKTRMLSECKFD